MSNWEIAGIVVLVIIVLLVIIAAFRKDGSGGIIEAVFDLIGDILEAIFSHH